MEQRILAAIGAGGKTTALRRLAEVGAAQRTLFTTTTHIFPLPAAECRVCLVDPAPAALRAALAVPGVVCAGSQAEEGKLGPLHPEALEAALACAELVLYEADGAHCLPLKLHRPDEPVLLPGTHRCLVVAGLSALQKPVKHAIHRAERGPGWDPSERVDRERFLHCIWETIEAAHFPREGIRVLLNQADTLPDASKAEAIMEAIRGRGYKCRAASLAAEASFLWDWALE